MGKINKKFSTYFFFILVHRVLSLSCFFVEGYKTVLSKSAPSQSKIMEPVWIKVMQMDQVNSYISFILRITALACLLYFMYILRTKDNSKIKKSLLLTVIYLILMFIIITIADYTELVLYGNTFILFWRSIRYIILIILTGIIRQIIMKLKERSIVNE